MLSRSVSTTTSAAPTRSAGLTVGKSTLSHHLRVLRESGITVARAEGTHRYVSLRRAELGQTYLAAPHNGQTTQPQIVATVELGLLIDDFPVAVALRGEAVDVHKRAGERDAGLEFGAHL